MPLKISKKFALISVSSIALLLCLWLGGSFYLYTQSTKVIYEIDKSKNLIINTSYSKVSVKNSKNDNLDFLISLKKTNPNIPGTGLKQDISLVDQNNWILYLHGTWGRLPYIIEGLNDYSNVLSVSYPGYSDSTGSSNTDLVNETAVLGLEYLNKTFGIENKNITVLGHSLGGSPAFHLASKYENLKSVVTVNTFTSMQKMCERQYYILCIFSGEIHPSYRYAKEARSRMKIIHNPKDEFIPQTMGKELDGLVKSPHKFYEISGTHGTFPVPELIKILEE